MCAASSRRARLLEHGQRIRATTRARVVSAARHVALLVRDGRAALVPEAAPAVALPRVLDARYGVPALSAVRDA